MWIHIFPQRNGYFVLFRTFCSSGYFIPQFEYALRKKHRYDTTCDYFDLSRETSAAQIVTDSLFLDKVWCVHHRTHWWYCNVVHFFSNWISVHDNKCVTGGNMSSQCSVHFSPWTLICPQNFVTCNKKNYFRAFDRSTKKGVWMLRALPAATSFLEVWACVRGIAR